MSLKSRSDLENLRQSREHQALTAAAREKAFLNDMSPVGASLSYQSRPQGRNERFRTISPCDAIACWQLAEGYIIPENLAQLTRENWGQIILLAELNALGQ